TASGQLGPVGKYDLSVPGQQLFWDFALVQRQGMIVRGDHQKGNRRKTLTAERVGNSGKRANNADTAASIENRLDGSPERLHVNSQSNAGKLLTKCPRDLGNGIDRIKDVYHNGQLRLQAGGHALRTGLEQIDPFDNRPRTRQ